MFKKLIKHTLYSIIIALFGVFKMQAQCTEIWGLTTGEDFPGVGTIFRTDGNGNFLNSEYKFPFYEGANSYSRLCKAANGKLYGIAEDSKKRISFLFEYNPLIDTLIIKYIFNVADEGINPCAYIIKAANNKLYGITYSGGKGYNGVLYEWDPELNVYSKKIDFDEAFLKHPSKLFLSASNGKIYGTAEAGNKNLGLLFEYDPVENVITNKIDFYTSDTFRGLVETTDSNLIVLVELLDSNFITHLALSEWDPKRNTRLNKYHFKNDHGGVNPSIILTAADSGNIYGIITYNYSDSSYLFEWNPGTNAFIKRVTFSDTINGVLPFGIFNKAKNGLYYGMTSKGGKYSNGVIYEWNPAVNTYFKKFDFDSTGSGYACNGLMQADNGAFYGVSANGGKANCGFLFKWDPIGNKCSKKYDFFAGENGIFPSGPMLKASNGKLYAVTIYGGINKTGTLFEWDPIAKKLTRRIEFGPKEYGSLPVSPLMQAGNGKIYGTTYGGGKLGRGVLFEWDYQTNELINRHDFEFSKGYHPYGSLLEVGNGKLVGTTYDGYDFLLELSYDGVIYEYDTVSKEYSNKVALYYEDGARPNGALVNEGNGRCYGLACFGGNYKNGVLFEWDPVTNNYYKIVSFNGAENGIRPDRTLLKASNGKYYGVTWLGGVSNKGTFFEWDPFNYKLTKKFDFNDGESPFGTLYQATNGKIYGVTYKGGKYKAGILYEWDPITENYTKKFDFGDDIGGSNPTGVIEIETKHPCNYFSISQKACDRYISPSGKYEWTQSGNYLDTVYLQTGCTEIITIHLDVDKSKYDTIITSGCNEFISPSGKYIWTTDGIYNDTIQTSTGCDSILTYNLTIFKSSYGIINNVSCNSFISPSGKYEWFTSGTYYDTISNSIGCDSIITVNLTINKSTYTEINIESCDYYISPSNKYVWTVSGNYTDTITGLSGCDSIINVNLTIHHSSESHLNSIVCDKYISPSGKYVLTGSGIYSDTIPNFEGCDSIITINLTVRNSTAGFLKAASCNNYLSPSTLYNWNQSGTYTDTIPNSVGCDSVITVELNVINIDTSIMVSEDGSEIISGDSISHHQWLDCLNHSTLIIGETRQSFVPVKNGDYAVINSYGWCTDTSRCVQFGKTEISEVPVNQGIKIYPNPTSGKLKIDLCNDYKSAIITISELDGRMIQKLKIENNNQIEISLTGSAGIYILTINTLEQQAIFRIVKY